MSGLVRKFLAFFRSGNEGSRPGINLKKTVALQEKSYPYKLNIGCGANSKDGWVNIDLDERRADIALDVRNGLPFPDDSCEIVYSEHFLEHLSYPDESVPFLKECRRILVPGGFIHVGVPDSRYVVESCIKEPVDPGFLKKAKDPKWCYPENLVTGFEFINYNFRYEGFHKFAFDATTLISQLERIGFCDVRQRPFIPELDSEGRREGSLYVVGQKKAENH